MPNINVDGNLIDFKPGQTIIEAARDHGIQYHISAGIQNFQFLEIAEFVLLKLKKCQSL